MKVYNLGAEAVAQSLLPVMTPKPGDAQSSSRASSTDHSAIDPQDPQSFSRLLQGDQDSSRVSGDDAGSSRKTAASDRQAGSAKSVAAVAANRSASGKTASRTSARMDGASTARTSAPTRDPQAPTPSGSTPSFSADTSQSVRDTDVPSVSDGVLSADAQTLPPDPRLNQTPDELALEAAAIAAAQLLGIEVVPQEEAAATAGSETPDGSTGSLGQGGQSGSSAGAAVSFLDQLALRTLQSSFRPSIASQITAPLAGPASVSDQNPTVSLAQPGATFGSDVPPLSVPAVASQPMPQLALNNGIPLAPGVAPLQAEVLTPLSLGASLVGVSATPAQAATIAAAGKQLTQANSVPAAALQAKTGHLPTLSPSPNSGSMLPTVATLSANQPKTGGEIFASQPAATAVQGTAQPASPKGGPGDSSPSVVLGVGQTVSAKVDSSEASGNGTSNSTSDQNPRNQTKDAVPVIPVKDAQLGDARVNAPISKPVSSSGTLGATETGVSKDSTVLSEGTSEEAAPVKIQGTASGVALGDGSLAQVSAPVVGGARALAEVASKPTVLPPVLVKGNEVWKVVTDALQRARSENPSHLAVEVRMGDGSTLGLEVRMSSAGLHASFRSESQALLKNLEAQWSGFVTKESPEAKVTAAVFEGRSSFGNSTESNTSGGERRQQMEDAASSAALSRGALSGKPGQSASSGPKQITPSIRTRDGRMAVYA